MLILFSYIVMRMSGAVAFNPIFGRVNYPNKAKAAFILVLSLLCYNYTGGKLTVEPTSFIEYGFLLLKELFVGFCLVFSMDLAFLSLRFATSVISSMPIIGKASSNPIFMEATKRLSISFGIIRSRIDT